MQSGPAALLGKTTARSGPRSPPSIRCACGSCGRHIQLLGYPATFAIYDRGDQEGLARAALREIKVADGAAAARRFALFHRPLEERLGPARAGGRAGRRPTRSTWPRRPIAAIRTR